MEPTDESEVPYSADPDDFIEISQGIRWECTMCGKCCQNVHSKTWLDKILRDFNHVTEDGKCMFLDIERGNRCREYETRSNICRGYPFVIKKKGDHYILTIHNKCSGIGHGPEIDIRERMLYTLKLIEDDLGVEFIIKEVGENDFRMYKVK